MFSPSRAFFLGTMASADFLRFVVTMLRFEFVYSYAPARPPRVSVITFTSYICCIYALNFGQYRTLFCLANSSISKRLFFMQFLFVRPRFCLRLLSDSASRRTPLSLANSSYCHACSGLSPPSYYACRAHKKRRSFRVIGKTAFLYRELRRRRSSHENHPLSGWFQRGFCR